MAILLQGLSLSFSLLGDESDLYTIPVLSSTKHLTFRFAASLPTASDSDNDRSLYTSSSWEYLVSPPQLKTKSHSLPSARSNMRARASAEMESLLAKA
jgi:hypothetical protein